MLFDLKSSDWVLGSCYCPRTLQINNFLKTRDSTVSYDKIFIKLQQLSFSFFVIYGPQVLSRLIQMLVFDSIGLSIRTTINTYQFCLLKWGRKTRKLNISGFQLLGWITYLTHRSVCSSMFYKKPKHILKQPSTFLL